MKSKTLDKLVDLYCWPAKWLIDRLAKGPAGLPLLILALIIVPPIFWLSMLALVVMALSVVL